MKFKKRYILLVIVLLCALVISIFVQLDPKAGGQTSSEYAVQAAFPDLTFNQPDGILPDPNNANRLFILEQEGMIRVFDTQNASTSTVFLDISDRVLYGGEQGLLGLAFHPNYSQNRYFYVDYVADNPRRTVIARYTAMADDPNLADPNSQQIILEVNQPFSNHKGGQLAFGADSCLYIGMGDGGSAGDPMGNGQSLTTLLGKILRIDVNSPSADRNYGIPNDNPYAGNSLGYREEIYAYGFRNPWRFSFDSATGALWVGDVGQNRLEEINIVVKGKNYGWGIMEGSLCYNPAVDCDQTGLELPIWNYSRDMGYSVIGGFVYHGSALPSLIGAYVYGDYGSGRIWALRYNGVTAENTLLVDSGLNIASFGVDQNSELYFTAYDGKIYELVFIIPEFPPAAEGVVFLLAATVLFAVIVKKRKKFAIDWHIRDAKSRSKH